MANFTFVIPDTDVPRVINALCGGVNLSVILPPITDPLTGLMIVTPLAARTALATVIKQIVVQYEAAAAQAAIVPPVMG